MLSTLLGIALLCYPLVATYLQNRGRAEIAKAYRASTSQINRETQEQWLQRAREYNKITTGTPILDPWLSRVAKDNLPYRNYLAELNPTNNPDAPIALITIPAIQTELPVFHGTDPKTLNCGAGHLYGSALPVGGSAKVLRSDKAVEKLDEAGKRLPQRGTLPNLTRPCK